MISKRNLPSHPVGIDGQNHIIAIPPFKFLPIKEFEKRQKSMDSMTTLSLMNSMDKFDKVIEKKQKAKKLKEKGNKAFQRKKYLDAERLYSQAIEFNIGSRPLWTNRAACRITMKKFEEAISDCDTALSIDPKCTRTTIQKGNALLGLGRYDEAKEVYESLRSLGDSEAAEVNLKKLNDAQETISNIGYEF